MGESIELSIEETNKLRAQLGLPLIPVPGSNHAVDGKNNNAEEIEIDENTGNYADQSDFNTGWGTHTSLPNASSKQLPHFQSNTQIDNRIVDPEKSKSLENLQGLENLQSLENPQGPGKQNNSQNQNPESFKHPRVTFQYDDVDTDSWLDSLGTPRDSTGSSSRLPAQHSFKSGNSETQPTHGETQATVKHSAKELANVADGAVFTLADTDILEDAGDELVNEALEKEAKTAKDHKERQKMGHYKPGASQFLDENDNDSDTQEPESVVLDGTTISLTQRQKGSGSEIPASPKTPGLTALIENLFDDVEPPRPEVPMKKLKKKKQKGASKKRQREDDQIDAVEPMFTASLEVEEPEDDIESLLSQARVKKSKARKLLTAEQLAHEIKMHQRVDFETAVDSGMIYDDTKDFLDTISSVLEEKEPSISSPINDESDGNERTANGEKKKKPPKEEPLESTVQNIQETSESESPGPGNLAPAAVNKSNESSSLSEQESHSKDPSLNSISSTLKYLRSRPDALSTEGTKKSKAERERSKEAELTKIQIKVEERLIREQMEKDPSFLHMKAEEREKILDRHLNEQLLKKGLITEVKRGGKYARYDGHADPLKDYNPQVNVEYKDNQGKKINTKQAWKELSHRYHGSAPKHKR